MAAGSGLIGRDLIDELLGAQVHNTDGLTEASTAVGHQRDDDRGALLRFKKSHSPTTALAIVDAIHALLDGLGSGVGDDAAVLALRVPVVTSPPTQ